MRTNFDFSEATELMKALDHYKKVLIRSLPYLDSSYKESLNSIWKEEGKYEGNYYESPVIKHWDEIDIHIVSQMWGSTSQDFELMEYLPTAILDFKTDIISDELVDFKTEDENLINYLNVLEHQLFIPFEFTLYN